MSAPTTARAAYQQSATLTASPGQLVVMLYDGARRFLVQAATAMREGQPGVAHQRLRRSEDVIAELNGTLDHDRGGEIASRLQGLYVFWLSELSSARVTQDAERVDVVAAQITELRESWAQIAGS